MIKKKAEKFVNNISNNNFNECCRVIVIIYIYAMLQLQFNDFSNAFRMKLINWMPKCRVDV